MKHTTYIYVFACLLMLATLGMTCCGSNVGINSGGGGAINCAGCGSTGGGGTGGVGTTTNAPLTLTLIDPPTCASPRGLATHLYLSVVAVQLNPDANAAATSNGWVDVPIPNSPKQIDVITPPTALGNLVSTTFPTGTYGALRLLLASNGTGISNNQCGAAGANCVITGANTLPIAVTSENTKGIVINSTGIAGAGLPIVTGGSNINILFDTCSSLIPSNGAFRMLPNVVAWAGGVQVYSISLIDAVSKTPLGSADAVIAMEQSSGGADRLFAQATPDANGVAKFYGPQGTFDFVAAATGVAGGTGTMYSPLALTGVAGAGGTVTSTMQLVPQGVASPGTIQQSVASNVPIDVRVSVQQTATIGGVTTKAFTIPILGGLSGMLATSTLTSSSCAPGACEQSGLEVPSQPLFVQTSGAATAAASTAPIAYTVFAEPFVSQGAGVVNCTTTAYGVTQDNVGGTISPLPGQTSIASTLTFAGCQ